MPPFSEVNFALLRETGIICSLFLGGGSLEMRTEKLCVQAVRDIPYWSVHSSSLRLLVTLMQRR